MRIKVPLTRTWTVPASDVKPSQAKSIELVDTWNSVGNSHTRYNHPASTKAIDGTGQRIYVADLDNNKIQVLHSGGNYITSWGTFGTGSGQFDGVGSVVWTIKGRLSLYQTLAIIEFEKFTLKAILSKNGGD